MPIVQISLIRGRSPEKKRKLLTSVSTAVAESLEIPIERVRVYLLEVGKEDIAIAGVPASELPDR